MGIDGHKLASMLSTGWLYNHENVLIRRLVQENILKSLGALEASRTNERIQFTKE